MYLINSLLHTQCTPDKQDIKLKEGGTLRANNGEWSDRVTLVTKEIRVHGKAKAAKS